jgi:hypothetical protein
VKTVSPFTLRATNVSRLSDGPLAQASRSYFILGRNARGLWVIRENTGRSGGVFLSREAALRFARLESPSAYYAVVHVSDIVEFDYAA